MSYLDQHFPLESGVHLDGFRDDWLTFCFDDKDVEGHLGSWWVDFHIGALERPQIPLDLRERKRSVLGHTVDANVDIFQLGAAKFTHVAGFVVAAERDLPGHETTKVLREYALAHIKPIHLGTEDALRALASEDRTF